MAESTGAFSFILAIRTKKNRIEEGKLPLSARGINTGSVASRILKNMIKDFESKIRSSMMLSRLIELLELKELKALDS